MTIHQLSIFIENKAGTLVVILRQLKEAGIQLIASTISDTVDYGICRIICSEPVRAYETLRDAGVAVSLCEVIAVALDDEPGRAADAISLFSDAGISVAYLYSFLFNGKGILIFRTDNTEEARETIILNNLKFINEDELCKLV